MFIRSGKYHSGKSGRQKARKSTVFNPELKGAPDIIFYKTFFPALFEIKSCSTFAPSYININLYPWQVTALLL